MKGQKQSKIDILQKKIQALTNVVRKLIEEINELKSLSQGTLTAFQLHVGKDEWEKIVEELYNKEKRNVEQQLEKGD
ncbi:MAG: 2-hydroxyacyl-CoA dehydratase [Alteromonadales bacterium]|nr:2-hydroxyacyl-CoA dehydratase [Alteromonadales bacterium]